ncbi:AraC family transcriptional regulator [Streptomyces sp. MST-110588]|uniref:AraC family transcriptional regulator n=1 Tax=Streptomyces sp. MST-110588 TaxID=2833628 RepID=UPI001F5C8609|nr:AraC family transcriptional regulator [Streptomyces sp. MST-110588]UNO40803.1 AraC family transcriptional regulator [Streptomyces sp. MST-110588]
MTEHARLWTAPGSPQVELFKARFEHFSFDRHSHEQLSVGVIESGAEGLHLGGGRVVIPAGHLVVLNPGEVHTGFAADEAGWRYRMFYFDTALVDEIVRDQLGASGAWFTEHSVRDPALFRLLRHVHRTQEQAQGLGQAPEQVQRQPPQGPERKRFTDPLTAESALLTGLGAVVRRHARTHGVRGVRGVPGIPGSTGTRRTAPELARQMLHDRWDEPVTLADLTTATGWNRSTLISAFRRAYGLPPHAYLMRLRANRARRLLLSGQAPAEVAAATGFADQAHLTRVCKRYFGVTPAAMRP